MARRILKFYACYLISTNKSSDKCYKTRHVLQNIGLRITLIPTIKTNLKELLVNQTLKFIEEEIQYKALQLSSGYIRERCPMSCIAPTLSFTTDPLSASPCVSSS